MRWYKAVAKPQLLTSICTCTFFSEMWASIFHRDGILLLLHSLYRRIAEASVSPLAERVYTGMHIYTVEPQNKGHYGTNDSVPCREVVPISEVK